MTEKNPSEQETLLTLSDFYKACKKNIKQVLVFTVLCGFAGGYYALTQPITYTATATFRDKGKAQFSLGKGLAELMGSNGEKESEIITSMKSRHLLSELIQNLNLQLAISKDGESKGKWHLIKKNIAAHRALNKPQPHFPLPAETQILAAKNISYYGEEPIYFRLKFISDNEYEIYQAKKLVGTGKLDHHLKLNQTAFTIYKNADQTVKKGDSFSISLLPLNFMVENFKKLIKINPDKDDKSLIEISYSHPDRALAAKVPNELMSIYQRYQRKENDRIAQFQIEYLRKRQDEASQNLIALLDSHAQVISNDLSASGFAGSEKEMEFLAKLHHQKISDLMNLKTEKENLILTLNSGIENFIPNERIQKRLSNVTETFTQISDLKQQRDTLSLALQQKKSRLNDKNFERTFITQVHDLDRMNNCCKQLEIVLNQLHENADTKALDTTHILDPGLLLDAWRNRLVEAQIAYEKAPENEKKQFFNEFEDQKQSFANYLTNQIRLYDVFAKIIEERLSHQQNIQTEYEGLDYETSHSLLKSFSEKSSDLEAEILQNKHVLEKMNHPSFELHSLDSVLKDATSREIISKASSLALQLSDQDNRSIREKDRIKSEIELHRGFLRTHLAQTIELMELKLGLIQDKIEALQRYNLDLLHQRITLLDKHIIENIQNRLKSLDQEQSIIQQQLDKFHSDMANIPYRWVSEELIKHNMKLNENTAIETTKLVESKNIAHNLELIQSAPLDYAIPPILPKSPKIILFVLLGSVGGFMVGMMFCLTQSVIRGVPATVENLRASGQRVAGFISKDLIDIDQPLDEDLITLRTLIKEFEKIGNIKTIFIAESQGPHYAPLLTHLLSKKGGKVLLVDLDFTKSAGDGEVPGMLQHLENPHVIPKIIAEKYFDRISAGGITRYSSELTSSKIFKEYISNIRNQYEWVVGYSNANPVSIEAISLYSGFDAAVVTVQNEILSDFVPLIEINNDKMTHISYVFLSD